MEERTDLISRQAAIETVCYNCTEKGICNGICDDTDKLRELPTLESKHGKWIKYVDEECEEANWYECPNCHRFKRIATLYCPFCGSKNEGCEWADNCGAKMDGE